MLTYVDIFLLQDSEYGALANAELFGCLQSTDIALFVVLNDLLTKLRSDAPTCRWFGLFRIASVRPITRRIFKEVS